MMKAVPVLATGTFQERPAAPSLRGILATTWVHRMPETAAPPITVTPDGTIDLQWIDGRFRVAGPDKDPKTEILPAATTVIGFRFRPAAASAWLGVPASEIVEGRPALDDLWGAQARRLADDVRGHRDIAGLVGALEYAIARHAPPSIDEAMGAAHALIEAGPPPGAPLLAWLGRALAMSERTLRRRFHASFGYGPKTLDRILRYQRFLRLAPLSKSSTAVLAAEAGYSDQAHLVRESRRLSGTTPRQLEQIMSESVMAR